MKHSYDNVTDLIVCNNFSFVIRIEVVIMGNLNFDFAQALSQQTKLLLSLTKSPTDITATTSSQLDVIIINKCSYKTQLLYLVVLVFTILLLCIFV